MSEGSKSAPLRFGLKIGAIAINNPDTGKMLGEAYRACPKKPNQETTPF